MLKGGERGKGKALKGDVFDDDGYDEGRGHESKCFAFFLEDNSR